MDWQGFLQVFILIYYISQLFSLFLGNIFEKETYMN